MQSLLFSGLLVALFFSFVAAQRISAGNCPTVGVKKDLDIGNFLDLWYEIEKNPVASEAGLKCNTAMFFTNEDKIIVVNSGIGGSGKMTSIMGKLTIPNENIPAKLKVKFDNWPYTADYWILETDYDKYALIYSCVGVMNFYKAEYIWVLSRKNKMEDEIKDHIYKLLDYNKISRKSLMRNTQDC